MSGGWVGSLERGLKRQTSSRLVLGRHYFDIVLEGASIVVHNSFEPYQAEPALIFVTNSLLWNLNNVRVLDPGLKVYLLTSIKRAPMAAS